MFFNIRKHRTWLIVVSALLILTAVFALGYEYGQEMNNAADLEVVPPTKESPPDKAVATVSQYGLDISVVNCQRVAPGIECRLTILSREETQELTVHASYGRFHSKAYPGDGNDYVANYVELGTVEGNHAANKLVQNEPMNIILRFIDVPDKATRLTALNLSFRIKNRGILEDIIFKEISHRKMRQVSQRIVIW